MKTVLNFTPSPPITLSNVQRHQKYPFNYYSKTRLFPHSSQTYSLCVSNGFTFCFTVSCKLETSKDDKTKKKKTKNASVVVPNRKIVVQESNGVPSLSEEGANANKKPSEPKRKDDVALGFMKKFWRRVLSILSNLPLALAEMFAVAALMALGTAIEQGEAPDFYLQKYPEDNPVFGFFTWKWVLTLGFDHMFSSPVFLGTLGLLGASLMACTYTDTDTLSEDSKKAIRKQEYTDTLPRASIKDLGVVLMGAGYEVFLKGPSLYAFKGLAGRLAPIGVHLALLLIMGGATLSAAGSFRGSVTVPQGLNFVVGDVLGPSGFLSTPSDAFNTEIHVNRFSMDYYDSGEVSQFHSDLSLFDLNGKEVMRKTISVNDPLRYEGITIYQTDWSFSALQILKDGEGPYNLAMAPLKINGDKKLYGTFLPVGNVDSSNVKGMNVSKSNKLLLVTGELNLYMGRIRGYLGFPTSKSIVLYDQDGKFAGVRRPNSKLPIEIDGVKIVIEDAIGSTGLDIKTDPGVPIVYTGFGALMLTTCISFLSHAQIWALQDRTSVVIGGKTNRAKGEFPEEMDLLLNRVPEIIESSSSKRSDVISG